MKSRVRYRDRDHTYWLGKIQLPSVTNICSDAGLIDARHFTVGAAQRGTDVHDEIARWIKGKIEVKGDLVFLHGFLAFVRNTGFVALESEKLVYSLVHGIAGRCDIIGILNGRMIVLEIKTGNEYGWWAYQLSGYQICIEEMGLAGIAARFSIRLHDDGSYSLKEQPDRRKEFLELVKQVKGQDKWTSKTPNSIRHGNNSKYTSKACARVDQE